MSSVLFSAEFEQINKKKKQVLLLKTLSYKLNI